MANRALPSLARLGRMRRRIAWPTAEHSSGHRARLRQRLFEGGGKALLDHELVEYLLALAIPRRDTKAAGQGADRTVRRDRAAAVGRRRALRREGLSDGVVAALKIAEATALRLLETRVEGRPILSSWEALGDYLQAAMAHSAVEEVRVLFLNAKNMLIANEAMWRGSVDEASVHVREVISRAIAARRDRDHHRPQPPERRPHAQPAGHPPDQGSGRGRPAYEGPVHDHVIVGAQGRSSMKAMGLI